MYLKKIENSPILLLPKFFSLLDLGGSLTEVETQGTAVPQPLSCACFLTLHRTLFLLILGLKSLLFP